MPGKRTLLSPCPDRPRNRPTPSWRFCASSGTAAPAPSGRSTTCSNRERPAAYTTALKLLQIMTEKGLVERDERDRTHIYRARLSEETTQRQLMRDLVDRAFGGSAIEAGDAGAGHHARLGRRAARHPARD